MVSFLGDHCLTAIIINKWSLTRWLWTLRYDVIDSALPNSAGEQLKMCLLVKTSLGRIRRFANCVFFLFKNLFENWWIGLISHTWYCGSVNIRPLKWILSTLNNMFVMRVFPQIWNIITIFMNRWRQDQCQAVGPFSSAPQLSTLPLFTTFSALLMLLYLHWATFLFFWVIIGNNRCFLPPKL